MITVVNEGALQSEVSTESRVNHLVQSSQYQPTKEHIYTEVHVPNASNLPI